MTNAFLFFLFLKTTIVNDRLSADNRVFTGSNTVSTSSSQSQSISECVPNYTSNDIRTIEEMFPNVDRQNIIILLDKHEGNIDLTVNELIQASVE
jgi:hypothetical protein